MSSESISQTASSRSRAGWQLPLLLAVAALLRAINLAGRPLWYDEAFAILYAEKPFGTMIYGAVAQVGGAAADVHPIFFYSLLHVWMQYVGQTPFAVRCLSAILGVATVAGVYALGRELAGHRRGMAAAGMAAVAPLAVYYSQEARMYALLGLAGICSAYAFVRAWKSGGWGWWLAFGLAGACTLYAHNLGVVFLIGLDGWGLIMCIKARRARHLAPWVLAHGLMLGLFAPWLAFLPAQLGKIQQAYWVQQPGLVTLIQTLLVFHFGYDNQSLPSWLLPPALFFSLLIPVMVTYQLIRWRLRPEGRRQPESVSPPADWLLPVCLTLIPIMLLFIISQVRPVYIIRGLLPSALAYYVLLGVVTFDRRLPAPVRWGLLGPAAIIVVLSLFNHYTYNDFPRGPYDQMVYYLRSHARPEDAIIHSNKLTYFPAHVYDRSLPQSFLADEPGSPEDTLAYPTQQALGLYAVSDLASATAGSDRVWLILFERAVDEYRAGGYSDHPHRRWMAQHYTQVSITRFGDLNVYEYESGPSPCARSSGVHL